MDPNNFGNPSYSRWAANLADESSRNQQNNLHSESPNAWRNQSYDQMNQSSNPNNGLRSNGSYQSSQEQMQQSPLYLGSPSKFQQESTLKQQQQPYQPQQNQKSMQNPQTPPKMQGQPQYQTQLTDVQSQMYQQQQRQSQFRPQITRTESQQYQPRNPEQPNQQQSPDYQQRQRQEYTPEKISSQEQSYQHQQMQQPRQLNTPQGKQAPSQPQNLSQTQPKQQPYRSQLISQEEGGKCSPIQRSQTQQMQGSMLSQGGMNPNMHYSSPQPKMRPENSGQMAYPQQSGNHQQPRGQPLIQQSNDPRHYSRQISGSGPQNLQHQNYQQQQYSPQKGNSPPKSTQKQGQMNFFPNDAIPLEEDTLYDGQVGPGSVQPKVSDKELSMNDPFLKKKGCIVDFRQQNVKGWYFMPSTICVIICNALLGILLLALGGIVLIISNSVIEVDTNYSDCKLNTFCYYAINISEEMKSPVYVYLKMSNFYQNHRSYVTSYDKKQLLGETREQSALSGCDPVTNMSSLHSYQQKTLGGVTLQPSATANPCGLQAKSLFTDVFTFSDYANNSIAVDTTDIAWSVDKNSKYKRNDNYLSLQWTDVSDERFMNWMSFATTPSWKKLWGRIDSTLSPGIYYLQVQNTYNVAPYEGTKIFSLSTVSFLGGTSTMLGITFLAFGGIYLMIAMVILCYRWYKKIDDDKYYKELTFDWKK